MYPIGELKVLNMLIDRNDILLDFQMGLVSPRQSVEALEFIVRIPELLQLEFDTLEFKN